MSDAVDTVIQRWHAETMQTVVERRSRLPHALLLTGARGIGKWHCARLMARTLVCRQPDAQGRACGQCQSCHLAAAGTHPDIHGVTLEVSDSDKQTKEIKVDQIRRLCNALEQTSQFGGYKVAIIDPAERMNRNAANSLLKTLEEPSGDCVLILVSARSSRLPPTVRSRCQIHRMRPPPRAEAAVWLSARYPDKDPDVLLAAAQGAPFAAASLAESDDDLALRRSLFGALRALAEGETEPEQAAADWYRHVDERLFGWWISWIQDLIALASAPTGHELANPDFEKDLRALATRINLRELFGIYAQLQQASRLTLGSVNPQLLLESLLLDWSRVVRASDGVQHKM